MKPMLIALKQVYRRASGSVPELIEIGINPEAIEEATPHADKSLSVACVKLAVNGDRAMVVVGTVQEIVRQTYEAVWGPDAGSQDDEIGAT